MKAIEIDNGKVSNVVIVDSLGSGQLVKPDGIGIGWTVNQDGTYSPPAKPELTEGQKATKERAWRDSELRSADVAIFKANDQGSDAADLIAYRIALRDWPESQNFPDENNRPLSP